MLLSEPGKTEFDLNFNVLGFDVRVHPGFFLISLMFGRFLVTGRDINTGVGVLMGVAIFFVSVLIHELGHSLAFRRFGWHSRIVLHWMGGVAIPERSFGRNKSLTHYEGIIVSLAGPVAGLLLGIALIVIAYFSVPQNGYYQIGPLQIPSFKDGTLLMAVVQGMILINIFLNLLNLVPLYPLDGGQISRYLFEIFDPWNGTRNSLMLSIATAGLGALWGLSRGDTFLAIFCFYLSLSKLPST